MSTRRVTRSRALALMLLLPAAHVAAADSPRFVLRGAGALDADPAPQSDDRMRLRGALVATGSASGSLRQANARFALTAILSPTSIACSADTIFRDAFDGTGL